MARSPKGCGFTVLCLLGLTARTRLGLTHPRALAERTATALLWELSCPPQRLSRFALLVDAVFHAHKAARHWRGCLQPQRLPNQALSEELDGGGGNL